MALITGQIAPDFSALGTDDQTIKLSELKGKQVVLYFYPKDHTPGCTNESIDFAKMHEQFLQNNTLIFGISRDSLDSHKKFKEKLQLPFTLISDADSILCNLYDVIKEKNMYGKKYMGIERITFLIDAEGKIKHIWRKVKVKGHVDEVLAATT